MSSWLELHPRTTFPLPRPLEHQHVTRLLHGDITIMTSALGRHGTATVSRPHPTLPIWSRRPPNQMYASYAICTWVMCLLEFILKRMTVLHKHCSSRCWRFFVLVLLLLTHNLIESQCLVCSMATSHRAVVRNNCTRFPHFQISSYTNNDHWGTVNCASEADVLLCVSTLLQPFYFLPSSCFTML